MVSCQHKTVEQQYIDFINDPKYRITQQIKIGDVQTTVKWLPSEYLELKKATQEGEHESSDDGFYTYFDVKFDKTKAEKLSRDKKLYLDFDMQYDFVLLKGKDSILPAICQKIENGISDCYQYILAFENDNAKMIVDDFTLVYSDKIFGTGVQAFVYRQDDIKRIPKFKREIEQ